MRNICHIIATLTACLLCVMPLRAQQSLPIVDATFKGITVEEAFGRLKRQTGYDFVYRQDVLQERGAQKVNIDLQQTPLDKVLDAITSVNGLEYEIIDKVVVVRRAVQSAKAATKPQSVVVRGRVTNEDGQPIIGATLVVLKGTVQEATTTNLKGEYKLMVLHPEHAMIECSYIGMRAQTVACNGQTAIDFSMEVDSHDIDQIVVTGYQTLNKRELA